MTTWQCHSAKDAAGKMSAPEPVKQRGARLFELRRKEMRER
ncbi:hypothetical protein GEOBRER4_n3022 [Citrifermentans bremense]|uniref:Uncharacterized protein n=1 Tax=Citrifermentans bremense TaxID=60035 RepID=A0A7R7IZC8_9BACT|nr:hypothetical protein [Citrifermentans bremense]BCO11516.1 hypothetical protein GEOBRER4_n3022 [Citrifermentans bremense]